MGMKVMIKAKGFYQSRVSTANTCRVGASGKSWLPTPFD
ncbi:hypothetical protein CCACVL1_11716 [Corchorus capsularis]|uniref:Uncharacterized protein n=1 Tax=Corchorus capsularis TaxID=210143 RepID=A0A1R3IJU5_COCAP|nr:hypothetical protein CCACVL1_11716 [Corchorus capsularis]